MGWEDFPMKITNGKWVLATMIASSLVLGGCFGPFKKKSSGGGGGGSSANDDDDDGGEDEGGKTTKKTDNGTTPPAGPATPTPPGAKDGYGCLQGVVTDGFTGQPIAFDASKIFVLIRGTKLTANKVDGIDGQYYICEIPGEETYPVYAFLDGYMPFESSVQITTTRAKRVASDGQAVVDEVKIADPLELQNIRLFPLNNTTRDLRVRAVFNGAGVKDAFVDLEAMAAGSSGTFAFEGTFANSAGTRILPVRMQTGDDGYATFPHDKLSLGAAYKVTVYAPPALNLTAPATANIVLGISGAAAEDANTYDLNVVLGDGNKALKAISCSTQFQNFQSDGQIKIMFNRDFKVIDKEDLDGALSLTANMKASDGSTVTLASDSSAINMEQASVSIDKNILTITPVFDTHGKPKSLDLNADLDTGDNLANKNGTVTYDFTKIKLDASDINTAAGNKVQLSAILPASCPNVVRFFQEVD